MSRRSKATLIGEVIEREVNDAIASMIVAYPPDQAAMLWLRERRSQIASAIRCRVERRYTALEIIDSATWHRRKIGKEDL